MKQRDKLSSPRKRVRINIEAINALLNALASSKEGMKPYKLWRETALIMSHYTQLIEHLEYCLKMGLIEVKEQGKHKKYFITEKGQRVLGLL
ncbi:MAG: hypothetical protein H3Z52_06185 [archaeon]|nr:hypothetical protein [archaeon]MCP8320511.1 hypothetical protein [archaeon]